MQHLAIVILVVVTIVAGVVLMVAAMNNRRKLREMEHRERLAMIERGVVPPPETNPAAFEASIGVPGPKDANRSERYRTAGVLLVGVGLGLIFVIGMAAGLPGVGFGIGGAWISLGAASLFNYWMISRRRMHWSPPPHRPQTPPDLTP